MTGFRCGCPEQQLGDGTPSLKLQSNRPLVFVRDALPGFSKDDIYRWIIEGYQRWASWCDWKEKGRIGALSEAKPGDVVHFITVADLGSGGVLADQMLPNGGNVLTMRINRRITWRATDGAMSGGTVDPIRTLCHETGHFMGHFHWPVGSPSELMEPTVSHTIIRPQPTEGRVSAGWFGTPVPSDPAPIPPTPGEPGWTQVSLLVKGSVSDVRFLGSTPVQSAAAMVATSKKKKGKSKKR